MAKQPVIGVVGLGTMGLGIAQVFAQAGFSVLATDATDDVRGTASSRLASALQARVELCSGPFCGGHGGGFLGGENC